MNTPHLGLSKKGQKSVPKYRQNDVKNWMSKNRKNAKMSISRKNRCGVPQGDGIFIGFSTFIFQAIITITHILLYNNKHSFKNT